MKAPYWIKITLAVSHILSTSNFSTAAIVDLNALNQWKNLELVSDSSRAYEPKTNEINFLLKQAARLQESGNIEESVILYLRAVDLIKDRFGQNHFLVAIPMLNVGIIYELAGNI